MKKVWLLVSAVLLLPLAALADEHEEEVGDLTDVWLVVPKRGMEAQFTEAATAHVARRAEAGESRSWQAYRVALGENIRPVMYRSCCFDYADMDGYLAEGMEKGLDADWNENVDEYVDHYHHYIEVIDRENSHWPDEGTDGPYFGATTWWWKQGAGPAAGEIRKQFSQMAKDDGWADAGHEWLWLSRMGGEPILAVVSSYANFAEMAPPEETFFDFIAEQVGEEEAAEMFTTFGSGFSRSDYTVWVHDPSLSTPADDE